MYWTANLRCTEYINIEHYTRSNVPIYVLLVSLSPKCHSISKALRSPSSVYRLRVHRITSKTDLRYYKVKSKPLICDTSVSSPNVTQFRSMINWILIAASRHPVPWMTLSNTKSKIRYICVTSHILNIMCYYVSYLIPPMPVYLLSLPY